MSKGYSRSDRVRHMVHTWESAPSAHNPTLIRSECGYAVTDRSELVEDLTPAKPKLHYCKICSRGYG